MKESLDGYQIVITKANADFGGNEINNYMEDAVKENASQFVILPSLGQNRYFSYMKQVDFVIGNSSSGILETPYLGVPTVNIGLRQKGRHRCDNILQSDVQKDEIIKSIKTVLNGKYSIQSNYWGNGKASSAILNRLKEVLSNE